MASRIAGITIEIGGDTSNLQKSLKGVDSQLKTTQSNLKDINKLLKLDPSNTELLTQKQKNLETAIGLSKDRLEQLKEAQSGVEKGSAEWDALQREIVANEQELKALQDEYKKFGSVASQQIQAVGQKLKDAGGKVEAFGKKLAPVSGAAAAIGGSLLKMGYDAIQSADDLDTLSQQTGISTDELQKMQYASELVDVSVEDITGAMRKLKTKIDPSNESLKKFGISALDSEGNLRDANYVFYDALLVLSQIENETERDQAAMELFGKSADSLAGIIDDGGAALRDYGQQAEDLGLILDGDTITALNDTGDQIQQMKQQITGTMATIGAKVVPILAPLLEKVGNLITKVTDKLQNMNPKTLETIMTVTGVVAALAPVIMIGGKLISGLGSIITVIGSVVGVLGGPLTIAIAAVIAIGVLLYKNWDKVKATAETLRTKISTAWDNIKSKITSVVAAVQGKIDTFRAKIDSLKQKFTELKDKVYSIWDSIRTKLQSAITLPHIKLPHFSVEPPGWKIGDLLQGVIPKLSISWYKKAYENPVMFTSPTVMATPGGLKGFGDGHGAEIVMGLDKLRELVGSQNQNVNVTVVLQGDARNLFKVVKDTNTVRTRATNYNALAVGG